jgi:hypothetical protein
MSHKTIVILQSNYIPWKGYFDLMAAADEFLLFDEVQYTKNDWRNRNRIALDGKLRWLTLPVHTSGKFGAAIDRVEVSRADWAKAHWETLRQAYGDAPFYKSIGRLLEEGYAVAAPLTHLSKINEHFLRTIAALLALDTVILRADVVPRTTADATDRLLEICRARGATDYVSGPSARNYLRVGAFHKAGIALHFANYGGYPMYRQRLEPFEHGVSMIDTLMQCGRDSRSHLKSLSNSAGFLSP